MKKVIVNYFLSLCFILLSGYTPLHAHAYQGNAQCAAVKKAEKLLCTGSETEQKRLTFRTKPVAADREEIDTELVEEDESESESVNFKKNTEGSKCLPAPFYAMATGCLFPVRAERIFSYTHFSCTALNKRYRLFQAFRI